MTSAIIVLNEDRGKMKTARGEDERPERVQERKPKENSWFTGLGHH